MSSVLNIERLRQALQSIILPIKRQRNIINSLEHLKNLKKVFERGAQKESGRKHNGQANPMELTTIIR